MSCSDNPNNGPCYVDNSGLCFYCGKPMSFDYWLCAIGPDAYNNPEAHVAEWKKLCLKHGKVPPDDHDDVVGQVPTPEDLEAHWNRLSDDERSQIYSEFLDDCIDASREPNQYWYPLLMPKALHGYVGD